MNNFNGGVPPFGGAPQQQFYGAPAFNGVGGAGGGNAWVGVLPAAVAVSAASLHVAW